MSLSRVLPLNDVIFQRDPAKHDCAVRENHCPCVKIIPNLVNNPFQFAKKLSFWYKKNHRSLPWRQTHDPYKIWISEIMLQQTTVATVIPYYKRWIRAFPGIEDVAMAPLPKVLKSWQGLGYYQRARNIHKTARIVSDSFKGRIPRDYEVLRGLPGFGPYTTGAVLSIAFDRRCPLIDANVRRVIMRLLGLKGPADTRQDKKILSFLDKVLPRKGTGTFNQALMELGALVCQPQEPLCFSCPVKMSCKAYIKGWQDIIPERREKRAEKIEAVAGIIRHRGRYFIQQRRATGLLAGLWEFPGGKIEKGESPQQALRRELKEELNVSLVSARHFLMVRHAYTRFQVRLHAFHCVVKPLPSSDRAHRWSRLTEFNKYPLPSATAMITESLMVVPHQAP